MQIRESKIPYDLEYPMITDCSREELLFFDIETTGLSATTSYVYLIGCGYYCENTPMLLQWLSEGIEEEAQLIRLFFEFAKRFKVLLHYNGSTFDLPYLLHKCASHQLPYNFNTLRSFDLYKQLLPFKKLLPLPNLQLKTVERFLSIPRKDSFSGKELIEVYTKYVARNHYEKKHSANMVNYEVAKNSGLPSIGTKTSNELLDQLFLHNAEDVKNLLPLTRILILTDVLNGAYDLSLARLADHTLHMELSFPYPLPTPLELHNTYQVAGSSYSMSLTASNKTGLFTIELSFCTLKYFFEHYKDYYYLPLEDTAIHKSIGGFVEKEYRSPAKQANCYVKKEGWFLPQTYRLISPSFSLAFRDKVTFFEVTEEFLEDTLLLKSYAQLLISQLLVQ